MFYHSLISDWNHGNAHFLRGVVTELQTRGHSVVMYEPRDGWSLANLRAEKGNAPLVAFAKVYPRLRSHFYDPATIDLERALDGADSLSSASCWSGSFPCWPTLQRPRNGGSRQRRW